MILILDTIDQEHRKNRIVYLHCLGGRGRTGVVTACWLIRKGLGSRASVIAHLAQLRSAYGLSPDCIDSEEQRQFVLSWSEPL
jgi:protein-tyrosine phosphatase